MKNKTVAYYRSLPYRRVVEKLEEADGEVYFVARIQEIPWIEVDGTTPEEAQMKLGEVFGDAIQTMLDTGDEIPEPTPWPQNVGWSPEKRRRRLQWPKTGGKDGVDFQRLEDVKDSMVLEKGDLQPA